MEDNQTAKPAADEEEDLREDEQEIWSWGAGTDGQLGTGKLQDEHLPHLLPPISSSGPISSLSCGGAHVIALTSGGRVLTWGRGTSGQLGHGEMANFLQPKLVESLKTSVSTHVSAGWNHSAFVSDVGCLFTCGDGSFGQLGHGDYKSHSYPFEVSYFNGRPIGQVACGMRHSIVLLKGSQVYGFGSGKRGQLGISSQKIEGTNLPQITLGLEDIRVTSISANGDHSAALSCNGHLYTWGRGFNGTSDVYRPQRLTESLSFTQVALGWNHGLALTGDGEVFMLGGNHHGVLGDPRKTHVKQLLEDLNKNTVNEGEDSKETIVNDVVGLKGIKVLQIAAGAEHSAVVTGDGEILTWGWGEHGQLGLGNTNDESHPQLLSLDHKFQGKHSITRVYCGSGFTIVVRTFLRSFKN